MKTKLTVALTIALGVAALILRPSKLPEDGATYTNWKITWKDSNGVVIRTFEGETATPRQSFGESNISYHWFGKPTFIMPPDENGNVCSGEMVK